MLHLYIIIQVYIYIRVPNDKIVVCQNNHINELSVFQWPYQRILHQACVCVCVCVCVCACAWCVRVCVCVCLCVWGGSTAWLHCHFPLWSKMLTPPLNLKTSLRTIAAMLSPLLADIDLDSTYNCRSVRFWSIHILKGRNWFLFSNLADQFKTKAHKHSPVHIFVCCTCICICAHNWDKPERPHRHSKYFTFNTCKVYDSYPHWLDKYGKLPSVFTLLAVLQSPSTPIHNQYIF